MLKRISRLGLPAALALSLATVAAAQENKRDPKVQAVLDQMTAAYKGLKALHLKMTLKTSFSGSEPFGGNRPESLEVRVQSPNKLWIDFAERMPDGKITRQQTVSDGANLWRWMSATNTYMKIKAPATFHQMEGLPDPAPELDILLRNKDPFKDFPAPNAVLTLGKPEKAGEVDVEVLESSISEAGAPFTAKIKLLIGQKDHLMRGLTFEGSGKNPTTGKEMSFKADMIYQTVNPAPTFSDKDFAFVPPPGAKLEGAAPKPGGAAPKPGGGKPGDKKTGGKKG